MAVDLTKLQFYSGNNYLKRSDCWGQTNASVTSTTVPTEVSVNHNLGYIPQFVVAINYNNDGVWWSNEYCGSIRYPGGQNPDVMNINPTIDTQKLYLNSIHSSTGTRQVKYGVYIDS